ncbi:MAG: CDP-diacylglycerol--serine O-phosphatidyltransferase [Candidatus Omnitrophica bacterium]|nr:CDP-diacylglycerol--serine O-phosphatidyltransferase [Candidatus Omnitrophota bacterium]
MNTLANLLTSLSLFCGFASVIFSLEGQFTLASWAIILAVVFDGLDGQVARLNQASSEFGKQFDSLVDVVVFGMAPSILGYTFVYKDFHIFATLSLFIYLLASVVRLAQYNLTPSDKMTTFFYGLPTTVSGGFLASFILICRKYAQSPPPLIFLLLVLLLAFLMVSRVRYLNLDGLRLALKKSIMVVLVIAAIAAIFFPQVVIFLFFTFYIVLAPFAVVRQEAK